MVRLTSTQLRKRPDQLRRVEIRTVAGSFGVVEQVLRGGPYTVASGGRHPVPTDIIITA